MERNAEFAIVGGGILGLAHGYAAANSHEHGDCVDILNELDMANGSIRPGGHRTRAHACGGQTLSASRL